jgi:hypothetical protein
MKQEYHLFSKLFLSKLPLQTDRASKRRVGLYLAQWFCWFGTSMGVAGFCVDANAATECVSTGLEAHYSHPDYDPYSICKCLLPNGTYISLQIRFNSNGKILESRHALPHIDNNSGGVHTYINTLSTTLPQQKYYCVWHRNLGYSSASLIPPNAGPPNIISLSIPAKNLKVGDTAIATIIVSSDSDDYTAGSGGISGTIGGFTVSNLSRVNDTAYTATFTITDGGTDVPSGSDIPVSIKLTDSAGNQMANAFTTTISQDGDAIDANKPTLAEVIAVTTPTTDTTPNYTFSTNEAGSIIYGGDCSSSTTSAVSGNNNITFNALAVGIYSNCTITVTDSAGNASNSLTVTAFTIAYSISIAKTTDGAENNGSTPTDAVFTVTVTPANASGSAITGNIIYSGTATNGADYATGATTFSIPDGSSTTTITLNVTKDAIVEGTETITATLSSPSQGLLATTNATANIIDNFQNNRLSMNEDTTYNFVETDFGGKKIKITQLPNVGNLYLDINSDDVIDSDETVTLNQEIEVIDISKLKFKPVANANGSNYASFQFQIYEGSTYNVTAYTMMIDITAVNDAPVNNIPNTQTTEEDKPLIFSTDNSNLISISDIEAEDAVGHPITITLTATNGTLTLSSTTDLTFTDGDGTDDVNMEFNGTMTDINTALEGMTFTPTSNYNGNASVDIVINDGALTDTDIINITINPVNDIPSFTKGANQTVYTNSGSQTIPNWATNISAGPSNESSQILSFIVTNDNNSLFSVQPTIDANGNLSFTPAAAGSAVVTAVLTDGIDNSAAQTFNIKVNPLPAPTQQTTSEPTGSSVGTNINCIIKNEGTITDAKIEPECSIEGGTLEGEIKNEGTIKDVTLAAGTKIEGGQIQGKINGNSEAPAILSNVKIIAKTELSHVILDKSVDLPNDVTLKDVQLRGVSVKSGKLEGTIRTTSSATIIKNVSLGENATIIGGKLAGTISGTPKNPAKLQHLTVEPQTELTNVIIFDSVELPTDVSLASGVRFTTKENIPNGVDLTQTLPSIIPDSAEVEQPSAVDLSNDPIVDGAGLLANINILPAIATIGKIEQSINTGFLTLKIESISFAVIPMKVRYIKTKTRTSTEQSVRLGIGQRVYFTTEDGMEVMANPAVQDLKLLKIALAKLNLPTFKITEEGNIKILATEAIWYSARPNLASTRVDKDTPNGFIIKEDGNVALIFADKKGEKREQILYPYPADMSALGKFVSPNGILEFEINGQKFKGRLDYKVVQEKTTSEGIKVTEIPDSNGDFMITYPDGTEQRLFALPE